MCPAETDFAWWLATRKQMLEVNGVNLDPELPGFDTRAEVIRRYEQMIGRPLLDLHWDEIFAISKPFRRGERPTPLDRRSGR